MFHAFLSYARSITIYPYNLTPFYLIIQKSVQKEHTVTVIIVKQIYNQLHTVGVNGNPTLL